LVWYNTITLNKNIIVEKRLMLILELDVHTGFLSLMDKGEKITKKP
jgi:hypothetical protein